VLVGIILAALFAVAGYQEARRFGRQHGRTPWGWNPVVWAVALGLSLVIGIVLLAIAERQGRAAFARELKTAAPGQPEWSSSPATSAQQTLTHEPSVNEAPPTAASGGMTILPGK